MVISDAQRWKSNEVESTENLIFPLYINEDIDRKGFS